MKGGETGQRDGGRGGAAEEVGDGLEGERKKINERRGGEMEKGRRGK